MTDGFIYGLVSAWSLAGSGVSSWYGRTR